MKKAERREEIERMGKKKKNEMRMKKMIEM
jgi:hypothetical protein